MHFNYTKLTLPVLFLLAVFGLVSFAPVEEAPREELPCLDKRFSVVVHIVKDSLGEPNVTEAQILGEVGGCNALWEEICVSLEVCEFRYIDNFQWDTLESMGGYEWNQMLTAHHQAYRINICYVNHIIDPPGVAGFASLGGINSTHIGEEFHQKSKMGFFTGWLYAEYLG